MLETDPWGIDSGYEDALGQWRETGEATRTALLAAMKVDPARGRPPDDAPVLVIRRGAKLPRVEPGELTLEDGASRRVGGSLPRDLPPGYHALRRFSDGRVTKIIVCPKQCYLPAVPREWGWAVQLYALRSASSWGFGDLGDLRELARWSAERFDAGLIIVNPLHAAAPVLPQQPSPYFPSTRCYRNLLYLRIQEIPGAAQPGSALETLAAAGRELNRDRRIDRDTVFRLKSKALDMIWPRFQGDPDFDRYCRREGDLLFQFAVFCALAERFAAGWRGWPPEYRCPDSPAVRRFAEERKDRIRFHQWVQWLLDRQFAAAGEKLRIMQDLPIGTDPNGADAWIWQDLLAEGVTAGAPPDEYNTLGQDWGLSVFAPHKLRAAAYEPFVQMIRHTLRNGGGLRIDHVMGLFRLYWIPKDFGAAQGAYVRYPAEDLLGIVALESQRAGAVVVGEDLGTVESTARRQLLNDGILSYRLMWFEKAGPSRYPRRSLAAVTTHDLPTIAGLWRGCDLETQKRLGLKPNEKGLRAIRRRLRAMTGVPGDAPVEDVILRAHESLAQAPSLLLSVTLEDALALEERPNFPATTNDQWPNWSQALPAPLETFPEHPLLNAVGEVCSRRRAAAKAPSGQP
jgi:4-alpha-glucanotransferase